jgi:hypothetical protein
MFQPRVFMARQEPPSPFDKLRVRTTVGFGSHKILILSLSKDEDFHPHTRSILSVDSKNWEPFGSEPTSGAANSVRMTPRRHGG